MLMVISRVSSAIVRASIPLWRQTSRARAATSAGEWDPMAGGTVSSSGAITAASPSNHWFQSSQARASLSDHRRICSRVRRGSSSKIVSEPPSGKAW